ncbi:MAG: hypothetical protein Q8O99_03495 [bacterium]|nr:hypothetical protein [bacterium]
MQQEVEVTLANPQDPEQPTHQCKTWEEYRTFKAQYERDMKRYEQKKRMYENQSIYGLDEAVKHDLAKYKVSKQRLFEFAQANDIENIRIEESEKISIKV